MPHLQIQVLNTKRREKSVGSKNNPRKFEHAVEWEVGVQRGDSYTLSESTQGHKIQLR